MSLSIKQHIDEVIVRHLLIVVVLLLEHHVGEVEGLESFLDHLQVCDYLATET
jgi:hypothetical protein